MMIAREANDATKQEGSTADEKITKASSSSASSWSRLKDPRIVRVSRAFGGKDRHSKVCTVRGLRDRRVRLSVPTAIQLYDLQDRLGLNQPSKVVDWLLNAAKHEIDELPPLQMPPGNFSQNLQPVLGSQGVSAPQSSKGLRTGSNINWDDTTEPSGSNIWNSDATLRPKVKETARESTNVKETWTRRSEEGKQSHFEDNHGAYVSSNNFFSRHSHSSTPGLGLLNNSAQPYSSLIRWDPSTLSLAQSGSPGLTPQPEDFHNFNVVSLASTVSVASGPQVLVYQPGITQSYFPSHITATAEYVPKQINFQMLNSNSDNPLSNSLTQPMDDSASQQRRSFHLSTPTTNYLPTQEDRGNEPNNEDEFHSR